MTKVRGMGFVDAVEAVLCGRGAFIGSGVSSIPSAIPSATSVAPSASSLPVEGSKPDL